MIDQARCASAVLLAAGLAHAAAAYAAAPEAATVPAGRQTAAEAAAPPTTKSLPEPATTRHEIEIDRRRIAYTATAGTLPLGGDSERADAQVFYVAYALDQTEPATRPVAFVVNGGPGASAAYLHLGALGPQRVVFEEDGAAPRPPARIAPNPDSWLPFADLVFIDPVQTGFSRAAADEQDEKDRRRFLGTEADLDALAGFIRLWLSRNERWSSPKFLVGESYGGFRVAALADRLAEAQGIQVNGAVLISPVLEFSLHEGDAYTLLPWVLRVPSFAAVARRHGKSGLAAPGSEDLRSRWTRSRRSVSRSCCPAWPRAPRFRRRRRMRSTCASRTSWAWHPIWCAGTAGASRAACSPRSCCGPSAAWSASTTAR